uniref:Uncharacterized protein n=1 Tax=White spot syndrome virus TaxID=342409 RepID=A0A6B9MIY3_9VIRU|nr:hypothetical protein [White spot syndrome virus]
MVDPDICWRLSIVAYVFNGLLPSSPSQKFLENFSGSLEFRGWTAGSA